MDSERPSHRIYGLPGPLSELPWSADFIMQAIEVLPVTLHNSQIVYFRPDCADSFIVGWPAGSQPEEVAAGALEQLRMQAKILHSTSWRYAGTEVVLTYLAVVSAESRLPQAWETVPVTRVELARGDATAPPAAIGVLQVLEHALRHLAWLIQDDEVIEAEISDWSDALLEYVPEPFRAFGQPV